MYQTKLGASGVAMLVGAVAAAVGCPNERLTDPTDVDTDVDTDSVATCDVGERASFEANYLDSLCRFYETCPDGGFETMDACRQAIRQVWSQTGGWDACLATECAAWLDTTPTCTRDDRYTIESCERMADR